jgi:hypothetical protein
MWATAFLSSKDLAPSRTTMPPPLMTRAAWRKLLEVDCDAGVHTVQVPASAFVSSKDFAPLSINKSKSDCKRRPGYVSHFAHRS